MKGRVKKPCLFSHIFKIARGNLRSPLIPTNRDATYHSAVVVLSRS